MDGSEDNRIPGTVGNGYILKGWFVTRSTSTGNQNLLNQILRVCCGQWLDKSGGPATGWRHKQVVRAEHDKLHDCNRHQ